MVYKYEILNVQDLKQIVQATLHTVILSHYMKKEKQDSTNIAFHIELSKKLKCLKKDKQITCSFNKKTVPLKSWHFNSAEVVCEQK